MKKLKCDLSTASINAIVNELVSYNNSLPSKCRQFVDLLTDVGIKVAYQNVGQYRNYLMFSKTINSESTGCTAILIGQNVSRFISEWLVKNEQGQEEIKRAEVSPILMAEFGSGFRSQNAHNSTNWQGTFPGQTHAFEGSWSWKDLNGIWHYSTGESPTMPIYKAHLSMYSDIRRIARQVFGG